MEAIEIKAAQGIECAADGRRVDPAAIERRGLLRLGRKLIAERARDDREGRPHRRLTDTHRRAILTAEEAEIRGGRS